MQILSSKEKRNFIAKAHHLKPVVILGQKGLTEPVLAEIDIALSHHELIKIKIANAEDKAERKAICQQIAETSAAEFLNLVGNIGIFYRKKPEQQA